MKIIITLLPLLFSLVDCTVNHNTSPSPENHNMYIVNKKYFLNHDIKNVNYEIYLNDILIAQSVNNNGLPAPISLNSYIFRSGAQKIRIKLMPDTLLASQGLGQEVINDINKNLSIFLLTDKSYDSTKEVLKLNFPSIKQSVPYCEHEWTFEAEAIKSIGNLENSQNLSKIDKEDLNREVMAKYEELRNLLNGGNGKEFMSEIAKAKNDMFLAEGVSVEKQKEYDINLEEYFNSHKNLISEINNTVMKIMGNGRAVALENDTNFKGMGALTSGDKRDGTLNVNYIILHKPVGSNKFEIFRYTFSFTALSED